LWLGDGSFLVGGLAPDPAYIGLPLHLLEDDGTFVRSFGAEPPTFDPANESATARNAVARNDTVWAARPDRYAIDMFSVDGEHLRTFVRAADWFPDRVREGNRGRWGTYLPDPLLLDLALDDDGLLWVVLVLGRPDAVSTTPAEYVSGRRRDWYRTLIEVIDPRHGQLVARTVLNEFCNGFTEPGVIYTHREDDAGDVFYELWDVELRAQ
jgi:hypothetical protein